MAARAGVSVSGVIARVSTFDAEGISTAIGRQRQMSAADVRAEWDTAARVGTMIHDIAEELVEQYDDDPKGVTLTWKKAHAERAKASYPKYARKYYLDTINRIHTWLKRRTDLVLLGSEMPVATVVALPSGVDQEVHGIIDGVFQFTQNYRGTKTTRVLIVDWKTTGTIQGHAKHLFQVCLYAFIYARMNDLEYSETRVCVVYTRALPGASRYHQAIHNPNTIIPIRRLHKYLDGEYDGTNKF